MPGRGFPMQAGCWCCMAAQVLCPRLCPGLWGKGLAVGMRVTPSSSHPCILGPSLTAAEAFSELSGNLLKLEQSHPLLSKEL